jgi:1,4-dihydroxy-2-naphthoate octaprenyltransferase
VLTLCVAFDLRDLIADARQGIQTVAVRLGVDRSIVLMRAALVAFVGLIAIGPAAPRPIEAALVVSAIVTWLAVEATRRDRPNWFYLGFIDGMMLLQAVLVWASLWATRR